jgi:hypothetical protein
MLNKFCNFCRIIRGHLLAGVCQACPELVEGTFAGFFSNYTRLLERFVIDLRRVGGTDFIYFFCEM